MRAHQIENGVVINTIEVESLDILPDLISAENGGSIGDIYDGESFSSPVKTIEERKSELAGLRFQKETAGIIVNGSTIKTDRESQAMITGAYNAVQIDPSKIIDWKGEDGWIQLDSASITAIATAVSNHVQACFTCEKELSILLETDIEIDITTGWPE